MSAKNLQVALPHLRSTALRDKGGDIARDAIRVEERVNSIEKKRHPDFGQN